MAGSVQRPCSPFVKSMTCRHCGGAILIRNNRDSVVAICGQCQSTIDLTDPNFNIIVSAQDKISRLPIIPLGSRGKLKGILWEVIGFMQRLDAASQFKWEEYLLFNPYQGYRWLTQANGHWNFVKTLKVRPVLIDGIQNATHAALIKSFTFENRQYKLYYAGQAIVNEVLGEFYWRVQTGETVRVKDFISPPFMLSLEQDSSEQNWSLSEYIDLREVAAAFPTHLPWPRQIGVAPNQPSVLEQRWKLVRKQLFGFMAVVLVLHLFNLVTSSGETAFQYWGSYPGHAVNEVSQAFHLKNGLKNLQFELSAPVRGTWLSIDGDLVNDKTGETFPLTNTVEFYEGSDSDGRWTEGADSHSELYSVIPEGDYHLDMTVTGARPSDVSQYVTIAPGMDYKIAFKRGVPLWTNFWWMLCLLMLYPIWCYLRKNSFETQRWADSDYSPLKSARQSTDND